MTLLRGASESRTTFRHFYHLFIILMYRMCQIMCSNKFHSIHSDHSSSNTQYSYDLMSYVVSLFDDTPDLQMYFPSHQLIPSKTSVALDLCAISSRISSWEYGGQTERITKPNPTTARLTCQNDIILTSSASNGRIRCQYDVVLMLVIGVSRILE